MPKRKKKEGFEFCEYGFLLPCEGNREGPCKHYEPKFKILDPKGRKCVNYWAHQGGMTLEEIGSLMGITRERVRQIQDKAEKRLRETVQHYQTGLKNFLED